MAKKSKSKKSRRSSRGRQKTVALRVGGRTRIVQTGSRAYDKYISRGGVELSDSDLRSAKDASKRATYLRGLGQDASIDDVLNEEGELLYPAEPPAAADQINPIPELAMPDLRPPFPDLSAANARSDYYKTLIDSQTQAADKYQQQIAAQEQSPEAKASQSFMERLLKTKSPSEVREDAYDDLGIDPREYFADQKARISEIDNLNAQYASLVEAKDTQIAQSYDKMASTNFINNQITQIERNAAPRLNALSANINSKAAVMEALQGNFAEAQRFVDNAVQDATADLNFTVNMYKTFHDINQDKINRLESKYQTAYDRAWSAAEKSYNDAREDKKAIGKLMLDHPNAGISINDSLDTAYLKAARSGDGDGDYKFTSTQLNKGALNAGLPLRDFNGLSGDVKNFYVQLSKTQSRELNNMFNDVRRGKLDAEEAIEEIESLGLTEEVESYLREQIESASGGGQAAPSFFRDFGPRFMRGARDIWSRIRRLTQR